MSDKAHTASRPKGNIQFFGEGGFREADTLQCVHCQAHWVVQPGSGRQRGFCMRCMGPTCGASCDACVPFERWLDSVEQGIPLEQMPIVSRTS